MVKKAGKKGDKKGAGLDFNTFMKNMQKDALFVDKTNAEDKFYRFGEYNLDRALRGGLPVGQIYSFQGPSGSGKSLAALCISRSVLAEGKRVMYLDTENKISSRAIAKMGLRGDENFVLMASEANLEDTLDVLMQALESDLFGLVVIDSVDALTTDEQDERDIHDGSKVGGYKAKVLSEWLGKVSSLSAAHDCSVVLVRQVRDNPNATYGNPETTSGGRAIEFYATTVLRFGPNKEGNADEDGVIAYQGASVKIAKQNQGANAKEAVKVRFYIGENGQWGFDKIKPLLDEAIRLGVWAPATPTSHKYIPCEALCSEIGATVEELSVNGRNNLMAMLQADETLVDALEKVVEAQDGVPVGLGGVGDGDLDDLDVEDEFAEIVE